MSSGEGRSWRVRDIAGVGWVLSSVFCIFPKEKYYAALEDYGLLRIFAVSLPQGFHTWTSRRARVYRRPPFLSASESIGTRQMFLPLSRQQIPI